MKIELIENKVYFNNGSEKKEIHPFWLRERVNGEEYLDKGTQQRLFDPTFLSNDVSINKAKLNEKYLEVDFNDGVNSKLEIDKITSEFSKEDIVIKSIEKTKWDSSLKNIKSCVVLQLLQQQMLQGVGPCFRRRVPPAMCCMEKVET